MCGGVTTGSEEIVDAAAAFNPNRRNSDLILLHSLGSALWRGHFNYSADFCSNHTAKTDIICFLTERKNYSLSHTSISLNDKDIVIFLINSHLCFLRTLQSFTWG
jgi:hypothetical protein